MKIKTFAFLFVLFGCKSITKEPTIDLGSVTVYKNAYLHIIKDKYINKVEVFDSLVYVTKTEFTHYLKMPNETFDQALERLMNIDESKTTEASIYFNQFNLIFKKNIEDSFILFFSKYEQNYILAELLPKNDLNDVPYSRYKSFNHGEKFLIIFNSKGEIERVHKIEISYD